MKQHSINLLILPTDSCNMHCIYCFHNPYCDDFNKMDIETVKKLFDIASKDYEKINIIWHGGEPLLMGLSFYKKVVELQKQYTQSVFTNSLQSNLSLMNEEMAVFFKENNFNIGSSFDGVCNDITRGNSEDILNGRKCIIDSGQKAGFIMVVSKKNIYKLIESYEYFKGINTNYIMNLYLAQKNQIDEELSLDQEETINKLKDFFDYWLSDSKCNIREGFFHRICNYIINKEKRVCSYTSCLGRWMGVDHAGNISPCNRHFPQEYSYGNIYDYEHLKDAFASEGFRKLITKAIERRNKCKDCEIYSFCEGGCNNVALNENGIENNGGLNCVVLKKIYKYIECKIIDLDENYCQQHLNPYLIKMLEKAK